MKNLLIVGTGGFAREVYWHAQNAVGYGTEFIIKGFLEGNVPLYSQDYYLLPMTVQSNVLDYEIENDDVFVIAIANSDVKETIAEILNNKDATYINVIHNTAQVAPTAKLGEGIILCQFTTVSDNAIVGNHVMLNAYTDMGHDATVGDYSSLMAHVDITGNCKVDTHTFWGSGSRALPGSKIGKHAKIGAGSVVLRKVKEGQTVFGVPAMPI